MILMMVPPAQAEAIFDAQDDLRDDYLDDLCCCDRTAGQPWRDDDEDDLRVISDPVSRSPLRPAPSFGPAR